MKGVAARDQSGASFFPYGVIWLQQWSLGMGYVCTYAGSRARSRGGTKFFFRRRLRIVVIATRAMVRWGLSGMEM